MKKVSKVFVALMLSFLTFNVGRLALALFQEVSSVPQFISGCIVIGFLVTLLYCVVVLMFAKDGK
jgi:hypothetical protein